LPALSIFTIFSRKIFNFALQNPIFMSIGLRASDLKLVIALCILTILSSCVSQKKIKYLQKTKEDTTTVYRNERSVEYKVQPDDNLYISIQSLSEKANEVFNQAKSDNAMTSNASIYLNSYSVNKDGNINFPVIGTIYVKDLTVIQIKDKMQKLVDEYLKETNVTVKLVNFNITMLGEVRNPGQYLVYQDAITIFQGIGMAGDLTDFANRASVILIRKTETGTRTYNIDLNNTTILTSPFYYLKPNDIVYISPLKVKQWGGATFPYATVFAAVTTLILLLTYINTF
jgi:polysaccharide export outer membrane protein